MREPNRAARRATGQDDAQCTRVPIREADTGARPDHPALEWRAVAHKRDAKLDLLARAPLFEDLSRKELGLIARLTEEIEVPAGKKLFSEGETVREFFIVIDGEAEVTRRGKRLRTCQAGDFLGDVSLIAQTSRGLAAIATTPMLLFVMTRQSFLYLLDQNPTVERKVLRSLAKRVLEAADAPTP